MSPTAIRGQLDGQWNPEHVTRPAIRNGAEQDALQDPEHITMANYGITDYPGQPGVSKLYVDYQSSCELTTLSRHQVPAVPYRDMPHNMGPAQYVPEHENVDLPVCDDVLFLHMFPTGPSFPGSRTMILAMVLEGLCSILLVTKPPFLIHRLTEPQCLASQRWRICDDSPAVASAIRIHRSMWFGWNQAPPDSTKW